MARHDVYFPSLVQTQSIPRKVTMLLSEYKHLACVSCACVLARMYFCICNLGVFGSIFTQARRNILCTGCKITARSMCSWHVLEWKGAVQSVMNLTFRFLSLWSLKMFEYYIKIQFLLYWKHRTLITKTSLLGLMLFRKQIDIYCENHIEIHDYTVWGKPLF